MSTERTTEPFQIVHDVEPGLIVVELLPWGQLSESEKERALEQFYGAMVDDLIKRRIAERKVDI